MSERVEPLLTGLRVYIDGNRILALTEEQLGHLEKYGKLVLDKTIFQGESTSECVSYIKFVNKFLQERKGRYPVYRVACKGQGRPAKGQEYTEKYNVAGEDFYDGSSAMVYLRGLIAEQYGEYGISYLTTLAYALLRGSELSGSR